MHIFHALFTRCEGGLEQAYVNVTDALKARGHRVTALLCAAAPYRPEIEVLADTVLPLNPHGFYDPFAIWAIRKHIKRLRPDLLLAHNGRAIALLAYASKGLGVPLYGVSHSYKTARAFHTDCLVVLSDHMRAHFVAAGYQRPITVIPNLMRLPEPPIFKEPGSPLVIGALGRFSEEKGFADFFQALHKLKQTGLAFTIHLGGDGPELSHLKTLEAQLGLAPYLEWKGWVQDKAAFYRGLDILCLPSRVDSFPMVALEALAYGLPLVATDAPGPVSILTEGINGLLVPRQDPSALANALHRLAISPDLASCLARGAREKAQAFGFDRVADQWDSVVRNVT